MKEAVPLQIDEALKRQHPSVWADTYYVNPFKVGTDMSMQSTVNSQVNQTQVDTVPTTSRSEHKPPVAGVQVSINTKLRSDTTDTSLLSTNSTKSPVTILYVIFNLSSDAHICLPKGTIIACPDENEPEVDVIEIAEIIEEQQ